MTINLRDKPIMQEFLEDLEFRQKLKANGERYKNYIRYKLETAVGTLAGGSWKKLLEIIDERIQKRIDEIKTQADFDKQYKFIFDIWDAAFIIGSDILTYKGQVEYLIKQIETTDFICPCCGKEVDIEYVDSLRDECNDYDKLAWFYSAFAESRKKDREKLKRLAEDKRFSLDSWCPAALRIKPTSARQRVDEQTKSTEEKAREWIAKRKEKQGAA